MIVWINALLDDGVAGAVGIVIVAAAAGWVWFQRNRMREPPERPFLVAGGIALLLGIGFQILTA